MTTLVYETSIKEHNGLRYKIQARLCLDGSIQQRHLWYKPNSDTPFMYERWIASYTRDTELAFRNMKRVTNETELSKL